MSLCRASVTLPHYRVIIRCSPDYVCEHEQQTRDDDREKRDDGDDHGSPGLAAGGDCHVILRGIILLKIVLLKIILPETVAL